MEDIFFNVFQKNYSDIGVVDFSEIHNENQISLIYERVKIEFNNTLLYFSVPFHTLHLCASNLFASGHQNLKSSGINCYAFATGRAKQLNKIPL